MWLIISFHINGGYPVAGWLISWKIPAILVDENLGKSPSSGNPHMFIETPMQLIQKNSIVLLLGTWGLLLEAHVLRVKAVFFAGETPWSAPAPSTWSCPSATFPRPPVMAEVWSKKRWIQQAKNDGLCWWISKKDYLYIMCIDISSISSYVYKVTTC